MNYHNNNNHSTFHTHAALDNKMRHQNKMCSIIDCYLASLAFIDSYSFSYIFFIAATCCLLLLFNVKERRRKRCLQQTNSLKYLWCFPTHYNVSSDPCSQLFLLRGRVGFCSIIKSTVFLCKCSKCDAKFD